MEITLNINKKDVMEEVAQATSYTGAKMTEDEGVYGRISTVDEDSRQLERFWDECRADLCKELMELVSDEAETEDGYELKLEVSNAFDTILRPSMEVSLKSYFVLGISGRWYVYTNKKEAGEYCDKAAAMLDDVHRKAMHKKKPTRPTYAD